MNEISLLPYLETAQEAARKAGRLLIERQSRLQIRSKGWGDLVTDADVAAQDLIREIVLGRFPGNAFLGEEDPDGFTARDYCWIVDPLDGTVNYVHGCPLFCVSIALEHRGELLVGVVYDPTRDECYHAARGQGTWVGEERLRASSVAGLEDALVVTSFPPGLRREDKQVQRFGSVLERSQSVRRTGSAALNLAYVAAGRFDAFWSFRVHSWDVAAGVLLVREAGGRCTNLDCRPYQTQDCTLLATNGSALHAEMEKLLSD